MIAPTVPPVAFKSDAAARSVPARPATPGAVWLTIGLIAVALLWCFWPTLSVMAERWSSEPQYSHGFLVPLFALVVLVIRRPPVLPAWRSSVWGVPVLCLGIMVRLVGATIDNQTLDGLSLLGMVTGSVLLVGGWQVFQWAWPALAFLAFMLPLPFSLDVALSHPLQRLATVSGTFLLQTFGYPALAEGNVILMDEVRLRVVDACSGLGMLMTFFALSTALALIVKAPLLDRLALVASAIPIAVLANVLRITATGMAYYHLGPDSETAYALMHDLAGWLMMPLALVLLWLELKYLGWLLVPVEERRPVLAYSVENR